MEKSGKWLVLTEKPSVAADVAKALGGFEKKSEYYESDNYCVTWAVGHILELLAPEDIDPRYKRWLIQDLPIIPEKFEYKPKSGQEKRLEMIRDLAERKNIVGLVNACDAGREGELIFREVYDFVGLPKPTKRLWLQSMTTKAICNEFAKLKDGKDFNNLADAARCRSECDWLIGMNITRAMTRRLATRAKRGEAWSVGRVQTPTLALVVKREMDILIHRAETYWTLEGRFTTPDHDYTGLWFDPAFKKTREADDEDSVAIREKEDRIFNRARLDEILREVEAKRAEAAATETRKESREIAPQLFDLTMLQREANRRFGMSASRTMQSAQRLYERYKLITYPRTDARFLPDDYEPVCHEVMKKFSASASPFGRFCGDILKRGMLNKDRIFNSKEVSDHFALMPTGEIPSDALEGDDARIFDLIMKRFLAAFMPHAVWAKVERITKVAGHHFRTRVQDLQEPGWREVYGLDAEDESRLPRLDTANLKAKTDGSYPVGVENFPSTESLTRPPSRLTEAKLLFLMEHCGKSLEDGDMAEALSEKGIGTPATRAEIIENLVAKEYMVRVGRFLKPTVKGIRLVDITSRIPVDMLSSVELTGEMEYELKLMEKGRMSRADFMKKMADFTRRMVEKAKSFEYDGLYASDEPLGTCPACKENKVVETFWSYRCQRKECEFNVWKEKNQRYVDRSLMADLLKDGRVGPLEFMTSSGTPYTAWVGVTEKGIMLFDEKGDPLENAPGAEVKILAEYPISDTYLGVPGKLIETEVAYLCEFENGSATPAPAAAATGDDAAPAKKKKPSRAKKAKPESETKKKVRRRVARMPKVLCGHPVSLEDFRSYILTGSTPDILDFKSKKGRPFGASLHMKQDGSFEFKFVSRKKALEAAGIVPAEKPAKPKRAPGGKAKVVKKKATTTRAADDAAVAPVAPTEVGAQAVSD